MASISLRNAGVIAQKTPFSNLDITIGAGDRLGLVAGNGRGKTTLLKCLAGQGELTQGDITRSRGLRVGYVEQDMPDGIADLTLYEAILAALPKEQRQTEAWRVDVVLAEFETPEAFWNRPLSELSGGWQRIALIARIWVGEPDMLLLDEPTNHLDIAKLFKLEDWLSLLPSEVPVIIASHDRDFLDTVTNKTLFLRPNDTPVFAHAYTKARAALDELDIAIEAKHEKESKEAQRLVRQARKLTNVGTNSGSDLLLVKSKQLRERAATIESNLKAAHKERSGDIRLTNSGSHAKVMLAFDDVRIETPNGQALFNTGKLFVFQGERLVLLGENGTGKSVFMRMLQHAITGTDDQPNVRVSPTINVGYVDQALSTLPVDQSAFEIIAGQFNVGDQRAKALLANAGFPVEMQGRKIQILSFGQRARLALLALRLQEPNFYLLDEPTNHIDIEGQEALEAEIIDHGATCIMISHDRSFVRAVGTRFLVIDKGRLREIDSPDEWWAEQRLAI